MGGIRPPRSDAAFEKLAGLDEVTLLFVEGTRVTDAGIAHLPGLGQCEQIAVGGTPVTDAGIRAARKSRPKIRFVRMGHF